MHEYEKKSFTPEQEILLRSSAGPSVYISNFLTEKEFELCRQIVMQSIEWPEHGKVAKYWGFGWETPNGKLLEWLKPKINEIIPNWQLDFLAVQEAITPWKLHADIRWYADKIPYKVILMPMDVEPNTGPVDVNEWPDTHTFTFHQRNFLSKWPDTFKNAKFLGNDQSGWVRPIDNPSYEGLVPGYHVTEEEWKKYFTHFPYSDLEGLTLEHSHKWAPRSLFHWDNTAVHCADNFLGDDIRTKRCLMLFTTLKS